MIETIVKPSIILNGSNTVNNPSVMTLMELNALFSNENIAGLPTSLSQRLVSLIKTLCKFGLY
jgi:hypothetical protein